MSILFCIFSENRQEAPARGRISQSTGWVEYFLCPKVCFIASGATLKLVHIKISAIGWESANWHCSFLERGGIMKEEQHNLPWTVQLLLVIRALALCAAAAVLVYGLSAPARAVRVGQAVDRKSVV